MRSLNQILAKVSIVNVIGSTDLNIQQLRFDSRAVEKDDVFIAVKGSVVDGHRFISKALEKGATVIICESLPEQLDENITYLQVENSQQTLALIACNYFDHPSKKLKLVGITGTNGKTTTATLLFNLFSKFGYKCGLISTVENKIGATIIPSTHTTPDSIQLNTLLDDMVKQECSFVFMEVSSHAIDQHRTTGVQFEGGVFTNLSHDHLDYHKTFKAYIYAKKKFFDQLPKTAFALSNLDDRQGEVMIQNTKAVRHYYSLRKMTDFKARIIENNLSGLHMEMDGFEFFGKLIGAFNAYNLLAVYSTAVLLGQDKFETMTALSSLNTAEGRFESLYDQVKDVIGIIDYAHTPDALEKVLSTIDKLKAGVGTLYTIVGCGGDRDRRKRPIMAKVACDYSDKVIFTSDNPRTENPEEIIEEMKKGIPPYATQKVTIEVDRKKAIELACSLAKQGDIILVAGKGHEKYQEVNGEKFPFDDKAILKEIFTMK